MKYIIVYTTLSDKDAARKIARIMVEERLAACANFFRIDSVYRWEGEIEIGSSEYLGWIGEETDGKIG
jgi:periplasmic divalent cation tolerance protein